MFRYFGSKASNADTVADLATSGFNGELVADAFGGLGNMGVEFKRRGYKVTTCDILNFPHAFQHARISCQEMPSFSKVCNAYGLRDTDELLGVLSAGDVPSAWFIDEFSAKRQFFTPENATLVSSAWMHISSWVANGWVTDSERKYAVASLLNSADSIANTAGTYYAYLKAWHRKSLKRFQMKWLPVESGHFEGTALKGDVVECLSEKAFDLLYLDPPYNGRDYSRYYHLPELLSKLSPQKIDPSSKSGQPLCRSTEGVHIREARTMRYLEKLIEKVSWNRLVFHYADGAHIPLVELSDTLSKYGHLTLHKVPALGFRNTPGRREVNHYIYVVE